jgi:hypothetical protein
VQFAWNIIERVVQNRNRLPFADFSEVDACRLASTSTCKGTASEMST